ncbi:YfcL family protein [Alteromonas sp. 5E99-2]|uniref:YfcL family protein n=1 Tax=Alteromonas sp. 5E99-2 TaxID=2817683 RepID=UPI001A98F102|nr:YfcL family protein [Alteromonas sp. 5E99-2]MBO1255124.1 YfcL family protein [Alteromonas sp. 5E99-2]
MAVFLNQVMALESALDSVVDTGTDEELFIASYLQGHVAVIAKPMEVEPGASLPLLNEKVLSSLHSAFDNNELESGDQKRVLALWQSLVGDLNGSNNS